LQPVQKVFVDQLEGNNGPMIREQLMALLANSGRYTLVEDAKLADATIKGRAEARDAATKTASGNTAGDTAHAATFGPASFGGGSSSSTSQSMTEVVVSEAMVLRLTLSSGETVWAWDDTKPCVGPKAKCAVHDLVAAAQGRPAEEQKAGTSGK
jgi:hypothetical protein